MILLVAATAIESALIRAALESPHTQAFGQRQLIRGQLAGEDICLLHSGIGCSNMAMQLSRLLAQEQPQAVVLFGCGGAYPGSGLKNGDLVLAEAEIFADLGVSTEQEFLYLEQLSLPCDAQLMPPLQQRYRLDQSLLEKASQLLPTAARGLFATVHCCSGSRWLSEVLEQRTGALCENMEGASAAAVCAEFGVPLLELRGISNPTGTRDQSQWEIKKGVDAAQQALLQLLRQGLFNSPAPTN